MSLQFHNTQEFFSFLHTNTVFTVATLPKIALSGAVAFAKDGRKGGEGEGAGAGTGIPVYWDTATSSWFTFSGNIAVTS